MFIAIIPLVVALVGLLMYVIPQSNTKVTEIGRILFFCGVLVTLWLAGNKTVHIS